MTSPLTTLSTINEIANLAGLFGWQMTNASFTPNGSNTTVSFHVVNNIQIPAERYIAGEVNTYNLIRSFFNGGGDPNTQLFNTTLSSSDLTETILRKHNLNRVPLSNADQPVDLGIGSQRITFKVIFAGTQYINAFQNTIQALFGNSNSGKGLGTLLHPFYGNVKNVLPIRITNRYSYAQLNCVISELEFITTDSTHLTQGSIAVSNLSKISKYFIGTENAVTSLAGSIAAAKGISSNLAQGL